eukprot:CAMPEP_0113322360 /NCGR_PEP_ID=MMETSP0010_2-20120614/15556_1 /TAXON_ID=216773 ORGANISM="Corethron hystrix, Strain 308" /NCGR_SAMPLE_ID=MMETSP0010_2 /ASSEMBLY_ACC=CAM_ASM_000155 /LENGTH=180 /DNA_ID=CAMNT_0000180839 /DNA_START=26 /DNA_END=568 /DNA_ORIENTATION=- /assembly_acc=CAM_ASM_000155
MSAASADAVAEAMAATKKYGAQSPEAASAWDAVEEMDAADNSVAYSKVNIDTRDFKEKIDMLGKLLEENKANVENIKKLTSEVQAVKIQSTASVGATVDPTIMKSVLKEAREAEESFGKDSSQARVAWEAVEEVASSDMSGSLISSIEDECLVEALEACEALEELNRAVQVSSSVDRFSG